MTGKLDKRYAAAGDLAAAILDSAHALVVTLDTEGRIGSFNRACELLTGYDADEVVGTYIWDRLLPTEAEEPIRQVFASLPEGGEIPEEYENAWVTRDGRRPVIAWNNSIVRNAAGEIQLIVGIGVDVTERRKTADGLATAQRLARIGSWRQKVATREEEWSDQFYRNLGLEPGSCPPSVDRFYEQVHPDDRQTIYQTVRRSIEEKQPYTMDYRVVWPDGGVHAVHEENDFVLSEDGEVVALIGTMQDVTESRRTADELSSAADRLSRAQLIAGIGNWEWTIETNEEYWSDQFLRNLGLEPGSVDLSSGKFYEYVHPDDREMLQRAVQQALETKQPYRIDFRVIWPDGTERLTHEEAEVKLDSAGKVAALTVTMQDVTELRETENRLQRLATRLEYAQRTARIGNWEWDAATNRQWWSDESYRVVGYEVGEVEANDESFFAVIHPDDVAMVGEKSSAAEEAGEPYEITFRVNFRDGTERIAREVGFPAYDDDGKYVGQNGTIQDITEQYRAEQTLADTARRLEGAMRLVKLGSWEWDPDSNLLKMSAETLRICGLGPEHAEVDNDFLMAMIPEEEHARVLRMMDSAISGKGTYTNEYHIVRPNGDKGTVFEHGEAFHDETTGQIRLVGTIQDITERKRVEEELARTVKRLADAQTAARIGNWEWDAETDRDWWSEQQFRNYGIEAPAGFVPGENYLQFAHPADREAARQAVDRSAETGDPLDMEFRAIGADGVERVLWVYGVTETDADGQVIRTVGTTQDVTARKRVEQALEESEARLRGLFEYAPVGIGLVDPQAYLIEVNQQFADFLGYSIEEMPGLSYRDYTHPDHMERSGRQIEELLAGQAERLSEEKLYIRRDGAAVWGRRTLSLIRDEAGDPKFMVVIVEDIDDRKRAERELALVTERLEDAQRIAHIGHWEWLPGSTDTVWSDEMYCIFGMEPGAIHSTHDSFFGMVHEDDRESIATMMTDTIESGVPYETEFRIIRTDGSMRHVFERGERYIDEQTGEWSVRGIMQDITERKVAEAKLRETAANLENSQRIARLGSWIWEIEEDKEWWSDEVCRIVGRELEPAYVGGREFLEYVHPDDRGRVTAALDKSLSEHVPYVAEYRFRHADGHEIIVSEHAEIEYDKAGKPLRMCGTAQDITEFKRIEQELQESEARLDAFFNEAPVGLAILDSDYRYVAINETLAQMSGAPAETILGKRPSEIMVPEKAVLIENLLRRTLEHGESIDKEESIVPDADGGKRYRVYTQFPLSGDPEKPDTLGVVVVDITERVRAERALQETMDGLAEAQKIGQMGSWTWDPVADKKWWSDQHYRIFGLEPGSIVMKRFGYLEYVHPEDRDRAEKLERQAELDRKPFSNEYRVIWPDGTERFVSEQREWVEDEPSGTAQWRGIVQDITDRKSIEQELAHLNAELEQRVEERTAELREAQGELVKSERLATLGQLTATVSHELRNPLGAMRTSMYVVEKKAGADDQRLKASIDRVNRNITRCDQIIDELLDYTRIRDLDTQQTNIDTWLGAVLAEQAVPEGVTVKCKFGAASARVPADTDRLRRAFINIFENACQAAAAPPEKGKVPRKPLVTVETILRKDRLEIEVSDNGPGVPADIREKIFEPLFSTKNFGVGLGLPTVSQIMKQHGGGVSIGERRGGGAKFALWLPLAGKLEIADS